MPPFVTACFDRRVDETLEALQEPVSPVVRSCHIGNNTANNWAWLALAVNTRQVQYDHTCYGVDELSAPWTVMTNHGYLAFAINALGEELPDAVGEHINDHMARFNRRGLALLNHGVVGNYRGSDLITHHLRVAAALATKCNRSEVATDTSEIARMEPLLRPVLGELARQGQLGRVFDRWVRTTRAGGAAMTRIASIEEAPDGLEVRDANGGILFGGSTRELVDKFFSSACDVSARLHTGTAHSRLDYPWLSLPFSYLVPALQEHALEPSRTHFWHAGGSASCYYVRDPGMQRAFQGLAALLVAAGRLPADATLTMIPTFAAQLFATDAGPAAALDGVLDAWRVALAASPGMSRGAIDAMASGADPARVAAEFALTLSQSTRESLCRGVEAFNAYDGHSLPISHLGNLRDPTYNKYGPAQEWLLDKDFRFPSGFTASTWGEAELLCRVLAEFFRDHRPTPTSAWRPH